MKKFIIKSNLLIISVMLVAVFLLSGLNSVNAATTVNTTAETKTIDLAGTFSTYYFYPEGYLTKNKNKNNELEKVKNTTKKIELLTGKEFEITFNNNDEYKYNNRTMREVTYNGENGYINVNVFKFELEKKEETKLIDLTNIQGKYYFYPDGYFEKSTYSRLRKVDNTKVEPIELTGNKFEIKTISEKQYKYNFKKMYEVIYDGQKGFINVNVLNNEIQANVEVHKIDFSKPVEVHRFYPDTYLNVKSGTDLGHVQGASEIPKRLDGIKEITFYTDIEYTLKTRNGTYKLYKAEMDGKTGFINVKVNDSRFYV